MSFLLYIAMAASCLVVGPSKVDCLWPAGGEEIVVEKSKPTRVGEAVDVLLTAQAALAWDWETGEVLYEKEANTRRPVASLVKLLTVLTAGTKIGPGDLVLITKEAINTQRLGAHVKLPLNEQVRGDQLYKAALVASANDAAVALGVATSGSEEKFVEEANAMAMSLGVEDTKIANATGLSGGEQYSTAADVRSLLAKVYEDDLLRPYMSAEGGVLITEQGSRRAYESTNHLLGTYLPILAGKTGYTVEAGENLAVLTHGPEGRVLGVIVLGSNDRFQDVKVLAEWIDRNYTWE